MAFVFALILIAVPLVLHRRGVGAAWLSLSVAALYALGAGAIALVLTLPAGGALGLLSSLTMVPRGIDRSYHDTYYIIANLERLTTPALLFGGVGFILWVLTRWDALVHQSLAKTLFWVLHLCVVAMPFVTLLLIRHGMPRRYIDYEEAMALPNTLNMILAGVAALAFLLIVALMLWSAIARLRR